MIASHEHDTQIVDRHDKMESNIHRSCIQGSTQSQPNCELSTMIHDWQKAIPFSAVPLLGISVEMMLILKCTYIG